MLHLLPLILFAQVAQTSAASQPVSEVWVGHQVVVGARPLPVVGDLETRSSSFLLAKVERRGDSIILRQRACDFRFEEFLGVSVEMSAQTVARLPRSVVRFEQVGDNSYRAKPWTVSWGEEDIDGDGHPGATVQVSSSMCSGTVYTASKVVTSAQGSMVDGALTGTVAVLNQERIIDTSKWCLGAGSKGKEEKQRGWFRYQRVDSSTTCRTLAKAAWPVQVAVPKKK